MADNGEIADVQAQLQALREQARRRNPTGSAPGNAAPAGN